MFHEDVAKIDRDVSYVAVVVHVCCKRLFQMFHLFFKRTLQVCLSGCCICFTYMLQVFYLDVAYVFNDFSSVFRCFCKCFRHMFQVFHLSSFIHRNCCIWMFQKQIECWTWNARRKLLATPAGYVRGGAGNVWGRAGPLLERSLTSPTR